MIEAQVPMDVRKIKAKAIGGFTTRQLACFAIAVFIDIVFIFAIKVFGIPLAARIYIVVLIDIPILAFSVEKDGLPMEQFITKVLIRNMRTPSKRRSVNVLHKPEQIKLTDKERKKREKEIKKLAKANPDIKVV